MSDDADDATDRSLRETLVRAIGVATALEPDPVAAVQERVGRRRSRRRRATLVGAAAVILVAAGIVAAIDRGPDNETVDLVSPSTIAERTTSTTSPTSSAPTTSTLPPTTSEAPPPGGPPLALREDVALAWTGTDVVVWGGDVEAFNMGLPGPDRTFADGAAYNPATDTWRPMSSGPLPAGAETPIAATTDAGVVIARGTATAVWDPRTDRWRELDDAPAPVADLVADGGRVISPSANAVLEVEAGTWRRLPAPPLRLERPTTAWTGDELIVIGGPNTPFTSATAIAFDPNEDRWRTLPAPPTELRAEALSAAWDGGRIVVVNYDMTAAAYDPATESWELLPAVPARFSEWAPQTISAGGTTVTFMAQSIVVLRDGDRWEPLPYGALPVGRTVRLEGPTEGGARSAIWSTDTDAKRNALTLVDLANLVSATPRRQVGTGSIELAPGDVMTRATFQNPGNIVETVQLTIGTGRGRECAITSTYLSARVPPSDQPVREELPGEAGPRAWFHDTGGLVWETEASDSDLFRITCDDPRDARRMATTARFS